MPPTETPEPVPAHIYETTLDALQPDQFNANRGTQRGQGMLERSLRDFGAARAPVADMHGNLIAGNKTTEAAAAIGLERVIMVETTGEALVVIKRMDLDLTEEGGKARQYALADNRIAELNLDWDLQILSEQAQEGIQLNNLFNEIELQEMYAQLANDTSFLDEYAIPAAPGAAPAAAEAGEEAAPKPPIAGSRELGNPDEGETITTEDLPPAKQEEAVKLLFLMPPSLRDQVTQRLNAVKNEHQYPTLAHALCHVLEIPYEGQG